MGNPAELEASQRPASQTKATFSGATASLGVLSLIITIISVAVPHWGTYAPGGSLYYQSGYTSQENTGHFGPFQACKYHAYYSLCGRSTAPYETTTLIVVAGICGLASIMALGLFSLFAILHVAMQLQRKEIWISFKRNLFAKLITASLAVLTNIGAVVFGAINFGVAARNKPISYKIGVCFYLQIFLIFVNALLVILSWLSHKKVNKYPLHIVSRPHPRSHPYEAAYDNNHQLPNNSNGVAFTTSSGAPYGSPHPGHQIPIQPHQQNQNGQPIQGNPFHTYSSDAMTSYANGHALPTLVFSTNDQQRGTQPGPQTPHSGAPNGSNGFTAVGLHAAGHGSMVNNGSNLPQPLPIQSIKPIQAVQPQIHSTGIPIQQVSIAPNMTSSSHTMGSATPSSGMVMNLNPRGGNGVSFTPQGRAGYTQMGHSGSMDNISLNSTLSSNLSIGSSMSTGSAQGPLRSSLKKTKQKDKNIALDTMSTGSSRNSSTRVRISLGAEQTQV